MADDKQIKEKPPEDKSGEKPPENKDFEGWLKAQPDDVQKLYGEHITGLKNTVSATRTERDEFKNQLRDAIKNAEKGSKLEGDLTAMVAKLDSANARADFYETAPTAKCKNPKAAFAIMVANDLRTHTGEPDWKSIREAAPELFGDAAANAAAGAGTLNPPPPSNTPNAAMNDFLRGKRGNTT